MDNGGWNESDINRSAAEQLFKQRQNTPTENERFEIWCEIIDFVIQTRLTGSTWKELDSKYSIERK